MSGAAVSTALVACRRATVVSRAVSVRRAAISSATPSGGLPSAALTDTTTPASVSYIVPPAANLRTSTRNMTENAVRTVLVYCGRKLLLWQSSFPVVRLLF